MSERWIRCLALLTAITWATQASAQERPVAASQPLEPATLEAFLDGVWLGQQAEHAVAGAVVTVVQNDQVILNKGYGYADAAAQTPVEPDRTLFRIASISKPFTWIAVMQLVEAGKLDLDADVNRYLDFEVPAPWGTPVTMRQLMSHSAGYEDIVLDLGRRQAEALEPLGAYLADHLPKQVRPPGELSSYSNHSTALAAHIVAEVSGLPWSDYIEQRLLEPLGMTRTVARHPFPEALRGDLAKPHYRDGGAWGEREFLHWMIYPAGMMSTTGSDMARFMRSLLADASPLLKPETFARMLEPSFQSFEGARPWRHGFMDHSRGDLLIFGHGGDYFAYHSTLMLIPSLNLGIFLSFNSEGGDTASTNMTEALRDWLAPEIVPKRPAPPSNAATVQATYEGVYARLRRNHSGFAKLALLLGGIRVSTNDDGYLVVNNGKPRQFVMLSDDRFGALEADEELFFHRDAQGAVTHLSFSGFAANSAERLGWLSRPDVHRALFGLLALATLILVIGLPLRGLRRHFAHESEGGLSKRLQLGIWVVALCVLGSLVNLASGLADTSKFYFEIPADVKVLLALMPIVVVFSLGLVVLGLKAAFLSGDRTTATLGERAVVVIFTLAALLYLYLGLYWNLLTHYL